MKTAKEIDRAYSWNRMDSNLRSDTLRQVGVPEDFIDPVRNLDFNEIENSYPEIAEWLMDSAGLFNEPMFEDNVHSNIPLEHTHNISINDPNQYWDLTDIIGEGRKYDGESIHVPHTGDSDCKNPNCVGARAEDIIFNNFTVPREGGMQCNHCDKHFEEEPEPTFNSAQVLNQPIVHDLLYHAKTHGIESKASEDGKSDWILKTGLPHVKYDADNPIPEDMLGPAFKLANQPEGLECPRCHEKTLLMLIIPEMLCSNCGLRYSIESYAKEILGFDELQTEDLTYEEIIELTKGIPIDEIPEKLRHAGMKLQFDPDFKAGDNPYVGNWESFSKEEDMTWDEYTQRKAYLPDHFDLDEQRLQDIEDGWATADLIICDHCGKKFDLEDSNGERDAISHLKNSHSISESGKLRERFPKGFVNFSEKRKEEIEQQLRDAGGMDEIINRSQVKPINSYADWLKKNTQQNTWNKTVGEAGSQIDVLYAEKESLEQEINDLESDSIRIGLVGSDQELIAIDDEIVKKEQELSNIEKQIDDFAGETDLKQFTKDFFLHPEDDIHDLLERQKKDVDLTETKEEDDLDEYGRNVNEDESSIWDLFKDNVPKSKESNLWDDNDYNKYKQKFLKKHPNSSEDDFEKQIQGSDYYNKESKENDLDDSWAGVRSGWRGIIDAFKNPEFEDWSEDKKAEWKSLNEDERKTWKYTKEGWEVETELYQQLLDGEIAWHELTPEMKSDIDDYIEKNNLSVESKSNEGMSLEKAFSIVSKDSQGLSDEEIAEAVAEKSGKSYQEVMDWFDSYGESYSTEGGYGSGKNRHGFGHSKWMKDAETNNSVIDSENMNRDAVPLEEYTYYSRKETDHHKENPQIRRLKDKIRKLERKLPEDFEE